MVWFVRLKWFKHCLSFFGLLVEQMLTRFSGRKSLICAIPNLCNISSTCCPAHYNTKRSPLPPREKVLMRIFLILLRTALCFTDTFSSPCVCRQDWQDSFRLQVRVKALGSMRACRSEPACVQEDQFFKRGDRQRKRERDKGHFGEAIVKSNIVQFSLLLRTCCICSAGNGGVCMLSSF